MKNTWPTVIFIFSCRSNIQRLAHIFLWQTNEPTPIFRPTAIKALHNQHFHFTEILNLALRNRQIEGFHNIQAKPFVFTATGKIKLPLCYHTNWEFNNMASRGGMQRALPLILVIKERCFFLSAS